MTNKEKREKILKGTVALKVIGAVDTLAEIEELMNYFNEIYCLACVGKILSENINMVFTFKGTKKEPLTNIYITGGSNSNRLVVRDLPKSDDLVNMVSYILSRNCEETMKRERKRNDNKGSD